MKCRSGFVSNSSSSSFVLIGKEISRDVAKKLLKDKYPVWFLGGEKFEGRNLVELQTPAMAEYLDSIEKLPEDILETLETYKEIKYASWYVGGLVKTYDTLSESDKNRLVTMLKHDVETTIYQVEQDNESESEEELLFRLKESANDIFVNDPEYQIYLRLKNKFKNIDPDPEGDFE
jgi:hypothetical protein